MPTGATGNADEPRGAPSPAATTGPTPTPPTMILVAAIAAGAVAQGGYFTAGRLLVTALVALACGLALLDGRRLPRATGPVAVACAALAGWILLRAAATGEPGQALAAVATLGYLLAALVVLGAIGPAERRWLIGALAGLGTLVSLTAWVGVAWRIPRLAVLVEGTVWRGGATLTYPNATAALLGPLAVLVIAALLVRPGAAHLTAAGYLLLVGVGCTVSRAGAAALLVGLAVLAMLAGIRATTLRVGPPLLGAAIALAGLAPAMPAAAQPRPLPALAALVTGAAVAVGVPRLPRRIAGPVWVLAAGAVVLAVADRIGSPAIQPVLASRWRLDSYGRSMGLRAALEQAREHPLAGTGVGRSALYWQTADGNGQVAAYAHNEYLQTLLDLGGVGLLLLAALIATMVVAIRRAAPRPDPVPTHPRRRVSPLRAGAIAALAAFAVHSGFDFLWHIAVLPLVCGVCLALAATASREDDAFPSGVVPAHPNDAQPREGKNPR